MPDTNPIGNGAVPAIDLLGGAAVSGAPETEPEPKAETRTRRSAKEDTISLNRSELAMLVAEAVSAATEKSADVIAKALIESRKPYLDPKQEANEETFRRSTAELQKRIRLSLKIEQESCPHMQGSNALSDYQGQLTSIVMHRLDTGLVIGICTNCQKHFYSDRPGDVVWFRKKSGNRMSSAGIRTFLDPARVQREGRPSEFLEEPEDAVVAQR